MRCDELHLHAIGLEILNQLGGSPADAVDGSEGFGSEEDALPAEMWWEFEFIARWRLGVAGHRHLEGVAVVLARNEVWVK